jgi:hypothetical protein
MLSGNDAGEKQNAPNHRGFGEIIDLVGNDLGSG